MQRVDRRKLLYVRTLPEETHNLPFPILTNRRGNSETETLKYCTLANSNSAIPLEHLEGQSEGNIKQPFTINEIAFANKMHHL